VNESVFGSRARAGTLACALAAGLVLAGCTPDGQAPKSPETVAGPVLLTVAVYGPPPVITAYAKIAADFTAEHPQVVVNVRPYDTHAEALAATEKATAAGRAPDLFLTDRADLDTLRAQDAIQPVDTLLGQRHVDFGDGFARDALEAYSEDAALQCMPTQISPMVVYYNTALVDLTRAQDPGGSPITATAGWSMDEFARAARQSSVRGRKGVYVAPSIAQVAPFVWSGGGHVVDDPDEPTGVTLTDAGGVSAMQRLLELVRDPKVTYTPRQIARRSALDRFRAGQLAMILGYRDLTPVLRQDQDLSFDVLPMPVLGSRATIGQLSAMCLAKQTPHPTQTADFLAYLVSTPAMSLLAQTGYVMPTNLDVTSSDAFLQPGQQPESASVFSDQVRRIHRLPATPRWPAVAGVIDRELQKLFTDPVIDPLQDRLQALDDTATAVLVPPTPSASPSGSPSASPTASPSASPGS
jgi:multiple sugar transport system substrate-binding protein